jgi:DNA-binding CsgD family transcriptional regulator/tetratricopeptide (TPR) repeat protein
MHEFARQQRSLRVLWGGCDPSFTPQPLAPLRDVARQVRGSLLAALDHEERRELVFSAALAELETTESLLVLEDMHWSDEATLDLFGFLGRRVHRTRSMIVATYRDDEVGARHPLRTAFGNLPVANVRRTFLSPLSTAAVATLAAGSGREAAELHRISGGNPLFVTELLAGDSDAVPATVSDAVLARAARLSPSARDLIETACVIPSRVDAALLERLCNPSEIDIDACSAIGWTRVDLGQFAFRHELVRRALEDSLSPLRQRALHSRVLLALADDPHTSASRLAHHAREAGDAQAIVKSAPYAAAQAAAVGAHREAASHLATVLQLGSGLSLEQRGDFNDRLAYEYYLTGVYEKADEASNAALVAWRQLGDRLRAGKTLQLLSRSAWQQSRRKDADDYCAAALAILESLPPGRELAAAYSHRGHLDMESHDNESAIEFSGRAIALAEPLADFGTVGDALVMRGIARLVIADDRGNDDLERALALAQAANDQERIPRAYSALGSMYVSRRRYADAERHLEAGLAYCERLDLDFVRHYILAYRARLNLERGRWDAAGADAEAVLRSALAAPVERIPALRTIAHLRVRRGDPDAATPIAEARALAGPMPELQREGTLAVVCAENAWLAGDYAAVARELANPYARLRNQHDPRMLGEISVWLHRVGALDSVPIDVPDAYALELAGDWRGSAQAWESLGCPYEQALALGIYGGDAEQRRALEILESLGAMPAAQRLRRQMRSQGIRGVPQGARASTRSNEFGLTRRELQVLGLLTDGLTNEAIATRLFLSTRTVEHHVSSILGKLGVRTRAQAIVAGRL